MATSEMQRRIVTHMNADHRDSVARYVEHQCGASRFQARNATMTHIEETHMTIQSGGQDWTVNFDPPLKTLSEARDRVIEMDKQAVLALGRSPISVKQYQAPYGFMLVVFLSALGTFVLLSRSEFTEPGSLVARVLPPIAQLVQKIRLSVLIPMVLIHGGEMIYMTQVLKKHSVPLFSGVWWKWAISSFIEGYGSFVRIKSVVSKQEAKMKSAKH